MSSSSTRDSSSARVTLNSLFLGMAHAMVDAASGFLLFRHVVNGPQDPGTVILLVILYNLIAFGGQAPAGLVLDRFRTYRFTALLGSGICATALLLAPVAVLPCVILIGAGNALFHVGAGALVLASSGTRASAPGVFVGPGAVGLCAGIWLGGQTMACRGWIASLLVLSALLSLRVSRRWMNERTSLPAIRPRGFLLAACVACLLISVTVRSVVGGTVAGTWRGVSVEVMVFLALAACAGKMLGGFVADRIGWVTTSVGALALSAMLVSGLVDRPVCAVSGMLLFQMTMAVTLKATHHAMPGRPGLAFGLPCMALLFGALPALLPWGHPVLTWPAVLALVAAAAILIAVGLRLLAGAGACAAPRCCHPHRTFTTNRSERPRPSGPGWGRQAAPEKSRAG